MNNHSSLKMEKVNKCVQMNQRRPIKFQSGMNQNGSIAPIKEATANATLKSYMGGKIKIDSMWI